MADLASTRASFADLTTLADVKAWLQTGQSPFPATDHAILTRLITAASRYIQTWLNRQIAQQDWIGRFSVQPMMVPGGTRGWILIGIRRPPLIANGL